MSLKLITAASTPAVSLVDAKLHLRVDVSDEDALITAYTAAATEAAEQITGRALMPQTWELTLDAFPTAFELTRVPVASVTSLKYNDSTGVQQTLSNTLYTLDSADDAGLAYVVPVYAGIWPDTRDQINAVVLRYVAGYADAASVPEGIKAWIKLMIGAMYESRQLEGVKQTYSLGFADRLLDRYRVWKL
jgi:uncharacterized phiE125 gp8 family phage protein